ncbi:MAG: hydroxyneurosporene-O-methyltransferase [Mycobacterium sp.]|jgi:hypothetical protein|nr:hydroxyneurosporene-O-methyltransferase [Mycobacterium sp.]
MDVPLRRGQLLFEQLSTSLTRRGQSPYVPPARLARAVESVRAGLRKVSLKLLPPPAGVLDVAWGFAAAQTIYAAARLGIADALADGPLSAPEIADRIGADRAATLRLLRVLAMQSIFAERADGTYEMTSLAAPLRSDGPMSVRPMLLMLSHPFYWEHYGHLTDSVRAGQTSVEMVHGISLFECFEKDPESAQLFADAMACLTRLSIPPILAAYDFSRAKTIVDVGGGNGQLLAAILGAVPKARGVLLEQQAVQTQARERFEQAGLARRADIEVGSFFDTVPRVGDLYLLKHILHDWDDEQANAILCRVRDAMAPSASLLLIECVIPSGNKFHFGKFLDLDMMIFSGGRERTADEFSDLLAKTGFTLRRIIPTVMHLSIIEASVATG